MLYSMTGFGRGSATRGAQQVHAQLRSVNHRGLDVRCVLPSPLAHLELDIVRELREAIGRGRIEARIDLEGVATQTAVIDRAVARDVHRRLEGLRAALGIETSTALADLLRAPGIWTTRETALDDATDALVMQALGAALETLNDSRRREGEALADDLRSRHGRLLECLAQARERAPQRVTEYRERLATRVTELREEFGGAGLDQARLATEVALLADRADVDEELHRAAAHLDELGRLLEAPRAGHERVGKRVDFFLQELGREINTMASKSRDSELTHLTIEMKTELESMREQTANVQ